MYLHQAVLVPFLVPAIVQEQANTALLRHDGSDECWVQAQVSGYSFNWHLIFSQAYNVCLSSLPYHGRSCGVGKGRLTHPPIQNPRFPLDWVYQRTNLSFEENTATPSWSVVLEEKAQPCWLWPWPGSCSASTRGWRGEEGSFSGGGTTCLWKYSSGNVALESEKWNFKLHLKKIERCASADRPNCSNSYIVSLCIERFVVFLLK